MFTLSKLVWTLLTPGNLFFLVLGLAVALLWTRWRALARRLLLFLTIFGAAVAVLPLGQWLLTPLENRFPAMAGLPPEADGIVVLGGSINQFIAQARGQPALGGGSERLLAAARLAQHYRHARVIFTGGSGNPWRQDLKEAGVARQVFSDLGLSDDIASGRVQFEDQSRNTYENALFSLRLAQPKDGEIWILVTSARHMPRAMGTFRAAGWRPLAHPVDYGTDGRFAFRPGFNFVGGFGGLATGLKEWTGLLFYFISGRTGKILPAP